MPISPEIIQSIATYTGAEASFEIRRERWTKDGPDPFDEDYSLVREELTGRLVKVTDIGVTVEVYSKTGTLISREVPFAYERHEPGRVVVSRIVACSVGEIDLLNPKH